MNQPGSGKLKEQLRELNRALGVPEEEEDRTEAPGNTTAADVARQIVEDAGVYRFGREGPAVTDHARQIAEDLKKHPGQIQAKANQRGRLLLTPATYFAVFDSLKAEGLAPQEAAHLALEVCRVCAGMER